MFSINKNQIRTRSDSQTKIWILFYFKSDSQFCLCETRTKTRTQLFLKIYKLRYFPFCFHYYFSSENFNYVAKDASILYFKSLQRTQASSILSWAVTIGLTISWLPSLQDTPPVATVNLIQAVDNWDGEFLTSSLC
jgi:hypothetical protein